MTAGKTIALTNSFVGKVMSLLFYKLSNLVITKGKKKKEKIPEESIVQIKT